MSYVVTFLSASLFILFLAVTGAQAEACKPPGTGPGFGRLDFVNIGKEKGPDGEEAHQAAGWGPIEPDLHEGNWGGIETESGCDLPDNKDCDGKTRVTWAGDCFGKTELLSKENNRCLAPAGGFIEFSYDFKEGIITEPDSFALFGRAARVVLDPNAIVGHGGKARQLRMRVLDGIGYDAFEVFVRNIQKTSDEKGVIPAKPGGDTAVLVYRFDPYAPENLNTKKKSELWRVHTIDLIAYVGQLNLHSEPNALEIIIQSTAAPWGLFLTYGQLAVDWIEILGTPKKPVKH